MNYYDFNKLVTKNCMEYAKYTITDRAIPDINGLKPIHTRILWSMYQDNLLWNKNRTKCANAVGGAMRYSPHGNNSIFQAMVRLTNDSVMLPYMDGKGAFSSCTTRDIKAGADRYCLTGDTLITTNNGLIEIKDIIKSQENSTQNIDIQVLSENKQVNKASKFFNSGKHKIREIVVDKGLSIKGSLNHPLLTLCYEEDTNNSKLFYKWKTLEEINVNDIIIMQSNYNDNIKIVDKATISEARMLGMMVSEGCLNNVTEKSRYHRIYFGNTDYKLIEEFTKCFKDTFPNAKLTYEKNKTKNFDYFNIYCHSKEIYEEFQNKYNFQIDSKNQEIPKIILQSSKNIQKEFLKYLFEGDGGVCLPNKIKNKGKIFYSSYSIKLIKQLQILLYNSFGIFMGIGKDKNGYKLQISSKNSILRFYNEIGFVSKRKQDNLLKIVNMKQNFSKYAKTSTEDYIPFITEYINRVKTSNKNKIIKIRSLSNKEKIKQNYDLLKNSIPEDKFLIIDNILYNDYTFVQVKDIIDYDKEETVYSIRVDSDCHSFTGNCLINHNTETRLSKLACSFFDNIHKNNVEMVDNYDNTRKEPLTLPIKFPLALCNPNLGIAVGITSNICSFNINEVIDNTIKFIKNEPLDILYPDFSTYGNVIRNDIETQRVFDTGQGSFKLRATYQINEKENTISITEIPYTTTREAIIEKVIDLMKQNKIKDIINIDDYTGVSGLEILIEVKKNVNKEELMEQLYKLTPLEDTFSCNFTLLCDNYPQVLGIKDIIKKWLEFRIATIKKELEYDIKQTQLNLNIIEGVSKIINDIDNVISIIRSSNDEKEIIIKLQQQYELNKTQLEYILKIKLVNLNTKWLNEKIILKNKFLLEYDKLNNIYNNEDLIKKLIISQLEDVKKEYGMERKTKIIEKSNIVINNIKEIEDYSCFLIITKENYVKKLLKSIKDTTKIKDNDIVINAYKTNNKSTLLIFTTKQNCYKVLVDDLPKNTPSELGTFIPSIISLEKDENIVFIQLVEDYSKGYLINIYENSLLSKIPLSSFETKQKLSKLKNSLSNSKLISQFIIQDDINLVCVSSSNKVLIVNTSEFNAKNTRNSNGQLLMKQKNDSIITDIIYNEDGYSFEDINYYIGKRGTIGKYLKKNDIIRNKSIDNI